MESSAPDLTSRLLQRERLVVGTTMALLVALSWAFLIRGAGMPHAMAAMAPPPPLALVAMWSLMMVAMMLPSAAPAILLYARVRQTRGGHPAIAGTWVFLAGYLALWLLFSIAAAVGQMMLTGPSMVLESRYAQGAMQIAAGLYQLSPLKSACVSQCRSPAAFISRHWRPGWSGAVRLGLLHGAYCVGCCWMLMMLLFVVGVMNLLWVVALTLIVALEKLVPRGDLLGRVIGAPLVIWGVARLAI